MKTLSELCRYINITPLSGYQGSPVSGVPGQSLKPQKVQYYYRSAQSKYQIQTGSRRKTNFQIQTKSDSTSGRTKTEKCHSGKSFCWFPEKSRKNGSQRYGIEFWNCRFKVSKTLFSVSSFPVHFRPITGPKVELFGPKVYFWLNLGVASRRILVINVIKIIFA